MIKDSVVLPGKSGVTYRLATQSDFIRYYGGRPPFSAKAFIFYKDNDPVAIGGYKIDSGSFILFSEIKENAILDKVTIVRAGKVIITLLDDLKCPVYASSKKDKLCKMFGADKIGEDTYIWRY
jgi:hypothetical protein